MYFPGTVRQGKCVPFVFEAFPDKYGRAVFALPGVLVLLMTVWITFQSELKEFSVSLPKAEAEG